MLVAHRFPPYSHRYSVKHGAPSSTTLPSRPGSHPETHHGTGWQISEVRTAVAVPVMTHGINVTMIFFYVRRFEITRPAVDFVVHMSLSAAIAIA